MPLGIAKSVYQGYAVASAGETVRNVGLTIYGDTQFDRSVYKWDNSSLAFDGTGDGIRTDETLDLSSGAWTMECWAYATSYPTTVPVIFDPRVTGGSLTRIMGVRSVSGNYKIGYFQGSWQVGTTTLATSTWYHLAWVYNGSNVKMYVNGSLEATITESGTFADTALDIASAAQNNYYWAGYLQDMRISNTERYTSAFTAPTQSLTNDADTILFINDLGFDGDNDIRDDGGSRRYIAPDLRNGGELDTSQYKFGSSSWYQSANGMGVELSSDQDDWWDSNITTTSPFTIEMWVRRQDNPSDTKATLFDLHANKFTLYYDESTNNLILGEGQNTPRITGGSLNTNTWYHVALTRNSSGVCKLWIDGTQSGSNYTLLHNGPGIFNMRFFGDSTSRGWVGHIDECRFSLVERYSSSFTPSTTAFENDADTAFLWHFEGTDAATSSIIDDNA